jgi:hypothetical protein
VLHDRGKEVESPVLGSQRERPFQRTGGLLELPPLEPNYGEVRPARRLAGGKLGDASKGRCREGDLPDLERREPSEERRNSLSVLLGLRGRQIGGTTGGRRLQEEDRGCNDTDAPQRT